MCVRACLQQHVRGGEVVGQDGVVERGAASEVCPGAQTTAELILTTHQDYRRRGGRGRETEKGEGDRGQRNRQRGRKGAGGEIEQRERKRESERERGRKRETVGEEGCIVSFISFCIVLLISLSLSLRDTMPRIAHSSQNAYP